MAYGKIKADSIVYDNSGSDVETTIQSLTLPDEGTAVKSTGESGGTKFLREDGDGTCSWQTIPEDTDKADKAGPTFTGDVTLTGAANNVVFDASDNALEFADDAKATFGAGSDLQLLHDGNNSYVSDQGTGALKILTSELLVHNQGGNETQIKATENGAVELYHDNTKKIETTTAGVDVTGTATVDGIDIDGSYKQGVEVITPGTSPTINCAEGNYYTLDLSSTNVSGTWTFTNVPTTKSFAIAIEITTGASTTVAWNSVSVNGGGGANTIKWNGGAAPTLGASKPSVVILTTDDTGASWYGSALVDFATV
tara:strand:- start:1489 stop:2421 length:933 start_codon:yes stop_codon:yes gene_type:complete